MANTATDTLSTETMNPPKGSYVNMVGQATGKRVSGTISNVYMMFLMQVRKCCFKMFILRHILQKAVIVGVLYMLYVQHTINV